MTLVDYLTAGYIVSIGALTWYVLTLEIARFLD